MDSLTVWMVSIAIGLYAGGTLVLQWGMRKELGRIQKELHNKTS